MPNEQNYEKEKEEEGIVEQPDFLNQIDASYIFVVGILRLNNIINTNNC